MVEERCLEVLGKAPRPGPDMNDINIKFTWLKNNLRPSKRKKKKLSKDVEIDNARAPYLFLFFFFFLS